MKTMIPRGNCGLLALWLLMAAASVTEGAEAESGQPFTGVTQVTAHELLVGWPPATESRPLLLAKPPASSVEDFSLEIDGAPLSPTGLARASEVPWRFLFYVDRLLCDPRGIRWQADTLLARLDDILAKGALEIIVADPEPIRFLAATRDESEAREALSRLALTTSAPGLDRLRQDFARALSEEELGMPPAEFASKVLQEESRIARARMESLLIRLADESQRVRAPKALFFSPGSLDLLPLEFYREALGPSGLELEGSTELPRLADELAANVAALGWATIGFDGPGPEKLLLEGLRIGKWRFKKPAWTDPGFIVVREAERDPELAEAQLALSRSLLAAGKAADARTALEKAIHHFYRDPRTADRQAVAWRGLGEALERLGNPEAALRAFKTSARLDPEAAPLYAPLVAAEATMRSVFGRFERSGIGWTVTQPAELGDAVASLDRLLVLTYQTEGPHDGKLHPLVAWRQADSQSGRDGGGGGREQELLASAWSASGTSEGIAAARLNRLLEDGELDAGDLGASLELLEEPDGTELQIVVEAGPAPTMRLRVSVGVATARGVEVDHVLAERVGQSATWRVRLPPVAPGGPLVALVEDLATGQWTAAWFD